MPVITISRMYGSCGSEVAERVADTLGWPLFDNAMVDEVATRSGLTPAEVSAQMEHVPSLTERIALALSLGTPESIPGLPVEGLETMEERVLGVTRRVIEEACHKGPAVFVGRGAQGLLADRRDALHVFCYAPHDELRKYAMHKFDLNAATADKMVLEMNRQREAYVKRHWHRKWLAHENYHLCVDTSWMGPEGAADLVLDAARKHFPELTAND